MKWLLTGILFSIAFTSVNGQVKDIDAIKNLNESWLKCYATKDSSTLSKILADDFILVTPRGSTMTKQDVLQNVSSDAVEFLSVHIDSVAIRMLRDGVGVITCKTTFVFKANDKETTGKNCYSDVYLKKNGKWSAVAAHVTLLPME